MRVGLAWLLLLGIGCTAAQPPKTEGKSAKPTVAPRPVPPPPPPPIVVPIASNETQEVKPRQYLDYKFTLPPRICRISGKIEGLGGGDRDFAALLMNNEDFGNWVAGLSAHAIESGRKAVWSFDEMISGPGGWHLVVSNTFAAVTAKAVTVDAKAVCPATEP
jgi:hypothetical protein